MLFSSNSWRLSKSDVSCEFDIGKYDFFNQNKKEKKGDIEKNKGNDKKSEPTPEQETDVVVINTSDIEMIKVKPPKKARFFFFIRTSS